MKITSVSEGIDFECFHLGNPGRIQGGTYFSKLYFNKDAFFLKINDCTTKCGIVETGKKHYTDLLFTIHESEYIDFFNLLEKHIKELLFQKATEWFSNKMEVDDVEHFFNSCMRSYKTNKTLIRTYVANADSIQKCTIFDENNVQTEYSEVKDKRIACIICIKGIRFTSNSFQLDIENKQILLLEDRNVFSECLIKSQPSVIAKSENENQITTANENENQITTANENENQITTANDELQEFNIDIDETSEKITLKDPKEIYYEMYRVAKTKAKETRKQALRALLDAKQIKETYDLDDDSLDELDDDDDLEDKEYEVEE